MLEDDRVAFTWPGPSLQQRGPTAKESGEELPGTLYTVATVECYVAAITELYEVQVECGDNKHPHPRGPGIKALLQDRKRARDKNDREAYIDRGKKGAEESYSPSQFLEIQDVLLSGAAKFPQDLRTRLDILAGHFYLLRGESRRLLELADLSLVELPSIEGITPCFALVFLLSQGKTNKVARREFMGALRHRDPLLCTMGSLALYLFWRWEISGEEPPSFQNPRKWYRHKVLVGKDKEKELSYPTQLDEVYRTFCRAGISSVKKTHAMRGAGARAAELHGVEDRQISRAGLWDSSSMASSYLTGLPVKYMRSAAGFSDRGGAYFIRRAEIPPPEALQQQCWPWVDGWLERCRQRATQRATWAAGGLDQDDIAAENFLRLLKHLRAVLLQDLAVLQARFPSLPHFAHPLFQSSDWTSFALAVCREEQEELPAHTQIQEVLPEFSAVLQSTGEALLSAQSRTRHDILIALKILSKGGIRLLLPATITGEFQAADQVEAFCDLQTTIPPTTANNPGTPLSTTPASTNPGQEALGPPAYTLYNARTVEDAWREWDVGIMGQKPLRKLEEKWGALLRPTQAQKVAFCRRKVLIDEVNLLVRQGSTIEDAVGQLELQRQGRSLRQLIDGISKARRQRQLN